MSSSVISSNVMAQAKCVRWFFEVWNEPNLSGFWEGADQKAYFELYDLTSNTIKAVDPESARWWPLNGWRRLGAGIP